MFAVLILVSCASNPRTAAPELPAALPYPPADFGSLAPGGLAYFYADLTRARPILTNITMEHVDMDQVARMLRRVDFLSGAVYPAGAPRRMMLHAWRRKGGIPGRMGLVFSPRWKKTASPTGRDYYHSSRYGLSVSIKKTDAFVSDGDPFTAEQPVPPPENLKDLGWDPLIVGWLENAGTQINNFLSTTGIPMRIPTERILFGIYPYAAREPEGAPPDRDDGPPPAGPLYELRIRIETGNNTQARALAALIAIVRVFAENAGTGVDQEFLETLRPLLANPPSQDGPDLLINTGPLDARGIALLLNRFSVYSR
jgi:hypothetical protein